MWAKTKKIVLSLSVIVLFALYSLQKQAVTQGGAPAAAVVAPVSTSSVAGAPPTSTVAAGGGKTPPTSASLPNVNVQRGPDGVAVKPTATDVPVTATSAASSAGAFKDGSYTGVQADAQWGTVEVVAVVQNGKLSDVQFTQYPNHRRTSREINDQAMPILTQEAVDAQQAEVDIVSGATDTSEAFIQSLSSALDQAAS